MCESNVAEIILGISIGGLGLRVAIAKLKKLLKVEGFLAMLVTLVCCFAASAIYILVMQGDWGCLLTYGPQVFLATQVFYRLSHKKK